MTKDELKNKLKELIPQIYKKVLKSELAATEYDELTKLDRKSTRLNSSH